MKKKKIVIYCLILSSLFLLLCTKNSPLYEMNDWQDVNAFFTMGKSMMHGVVPYVDLFEQKGPLLYLIYGIGSLISESSFIGVFILEVLFFTVTLYYMSKIINLFLSEEINYLLLPLIAIFILTSRVFTHGGSCEEFCFPFIIVSLYIFTKYLKTKIISNKETIIVGLMASFILWMKYSLLGFHIGFILVVILNLLKEKNYKGLLQKSIMFIIGFLIGTLPWLIYFGINNGLDKLIDVYFLFNMSSYGYQGNIFEKIASCLSLMSSKLLCNYEYLILIFLPLVISIKKRIFFKDKIDNIYLLFVFFSMMFGIYIGGVNFRYYALPIFLFMIFGLIFIVKTNTLFPKKIKYNDLVISSLIIIIWCFGIIWIRSNNIKYINYDKSDYAQFVFADLIKENKTILNYGFLDAGFYFTTRTIPSVYYFEKQNVSYKIYKENMDEQNRYIKDKKIDYVIVKTNKAKKVPKLTENYKLVKTMSQQYEEKIIEYSLYQKR